MVKVFVLRRGYCDHCKHTASIIFNRSFYFCICDNDNEKEEDKEEEVTATGLKKEVADVGDDKEDDDDNDTNNANNNNKQQRTHNNMDISDQPTDLEIVNHNTRTRDPWKKTRRRESSAHVQNTKYHYCCCCCCFYYYCYYYSLANCGSKGTNQQQQTNKADPPSINYFPATTDMNHLNWWYIHSLFCSPWVIRTVWKFGFEVGGGLMLTSISMIITRTRTRTIKPVNTIIVRLFWIHKNNSKWK